MCRIHTTERHEAVRMYTHPHGYIFKTQHMEKKYLLYKLRTHTKQFTPQVCFRTKSYTLNTLEWLLMGGENGSKRITGSKNIKQESFF